MKLHKMLCVIALCCLTFELSSLFMAVAIAAEQGNPGPAPIAGPYVIGNEVSAPAPLVQPLPPYTEAARMARIEGILVLQAVIRKDGTVDSFKILKPLGHGLDGSAINTIATKWRFKPGMLRGAPVDVMANIEVRFRLFEELSATILEPHWEPGPDGSMKGSGYGNLKDAASSKGFTYTCSCKGTFDAGYNPVKWIELPLRLEISSYEVGTENTRSPQKCELKVVLQDVTYEVKDGSLITIPAAATDQQGQLKKQIAKIHIALFEQALKAFMFDMGRFPITSEGLDALIHDPTGSNAWTGPYLSKMTAVPMDPWGRSYQYRCPGKHGDFDIISLGPDGIEGTDDDVSNWKL
jgi:general secretion pathway protein G